ncbi:MAG: SMI1/KNR4 family protein [Myxococcaceae bacterium]|nr:SMI1/KNR4 family protein [Myxococcaceae bacterium]
MVAPGDQQRLHAAFLRRAAALRAEGAQHLVENLQAGVKPLALSRLEGKLGAPLPKVLRTWWLLHDGEKKPAEGFAAPFHLLPVAWVLNERVRVQRRWEHFEKSSEMWPASGLTDAERTSPQWIPVAAQPGASVVLHVKTGRVFEVGDDAPVVHLASASLVTWFEAVVEQPLHDATDEES